ncbi:MAG: arginine repressor [Bacteroidota bacterium]
MDRQNRHIAIKQIISRKNVGTQEDLCKALKNAGFDVTQATLSRDMKELRIARINTPEGPRYVLNPESEEQRLQSFIGYEIEQIESNESLIVIKTLPGRAQGVAEIIDGLHNSDILGTIAGDNTIFITPKSTKRIHALIRILRGLMTEKKRVA